METLLWVLVPLLIVGIGWWALARARRRNSAQVSAAVGPETARDAASLLSAEAHRAVYRNLAQGNIMGAVQEYRKATGQGLKQSIIAVRSLEAHPQVHRGPEGTIPSADPGLGAPGTGSTHQRTHLPGGGMDPLDPRATPPSSDVTGTGASAAEPGTAGPAAPAGAGKRGMARHVGGGNDDAGSGQANRADGDRQHPAGAGGHEDADAEAPETEAAQEDAPGVGRGTGGTGSDGAGQERAAKPGAEAEDSLAWAAGAADGESGDTADAFTIPDDWADQFGSGASRKTSTFRISAEKDGEIREFGTDELPPAEYDQFQSLLRDKDFDGAAALLAHFSGLDRDSIRQLLETAPVDGPSGAMVDNISDFSFEGDGPDGHVQFSASDLPEEDRHRFLELVGEGRIADAAQIVHRHTGLPADMVEQLLTAFGKK